MWSTNQKIINKIDDDYPFIFWSFFTIILMIFIGIISIPFLIIDLIKNLITER
jgi:hypothetical protein